MSVSKGQMKARGGTDEGGGRWEEKTHDKIPQLAHRTPKPRPRVLRHLFRFLNQLCLYTQHEPVNGEEKKDKRTVFLISHSSVPSCARSFPSFTRLSSASLAYRPDSLCSLNRYVPYQRVNGARQPSAYRLTEPVLIFSWRRVAWISVDMVVVSRSYGDYFRGFG
jgi:hypothetical protein